MLCWSVDHHVGKTLTFWYHIRSIELLCFAAILHLNGAFKTSNSRQNTCTYIWVQIWHDIHGWDFRQWHLKSIRSWTSQICLQTLRSIYFNCSIGSRILLHVHRPVIFTEVRPAFSGFLHAFCDFLQVHRYQFASTCRYLLFLFSLLMSIKTFYISKQFKFRILYIIFK